MFKKKIYCQQKESKMFYVNDLLRLLEIISLY